MKVREFSSPILWSSNFLLCKFNYSPRVKISMPTEKEEKMHSTLRQTTHLSAQNDKNLDFFLFAFSNTPQSLFIFIHQPAAEDQVYGVK